MKRVIALKEKIINFPKEIPDLIGDILRDNTAFMEDKNAEQLNQGIRGDGSKITPPYANLTKQIKALKGQPTDRVTLKDTGDFHSAIHAQVNKDDVTFIDTDQKTDILEQKYGVQILGLTDENIGELKQEILKPELLDESKKYFDV